MAFKRKYQDSSRNSLKGYTRRLAGALVAVVAVLLAGMALGACERSNEMGQLRGQWQLMKIERPGQEPVVPETPRRYINFDQGLVQLVDSDNGMIVDVGENIGTVSGEDPDYTFTFPYNDTPASLAFLSEWGLDSNPVQVTIKELSGSTLVMEAGSNTLTLRKF